jgi:hypothetical protein
MVSLRSESNFTMGDVPFWARNIGLRHLIAGKFGAKMGMDFAKSQNDFAFYILFGTSWPR